MQYAIGSVAQWAPCYYFRLWVSNEGKTRAEKVEVFLRAVERLRADGQLESVARYSPLHLKWVKHRHCVRGRDLPGNGPAL
jgi:hypothetical protein